MIRELIFSKENFKLKLENSMIRGNYNRLNRRELRDLVESSDEDEGEGVERSNMGEREELVENNENHENNDVDEAESEENGERDRPIISEEDYFAGLRDLYEDSKITEKEAGFAVNTYCLHHNVSKLQRIRLLSLISLFLPKTVEGSLQIPDINIVEYYSRTSD